MGSNQIEDPFPINAIILFRDIHELEGDPGLVKHRWNDGAYVCRQEERPFVLA
jgi:hypothetical protein